MKQYLCLMALLCLFFHSFSNGISPAVLQSDRSANYTVKGLQVGDKVPDVLIKGVLNSNISSFKFSDFKGKILILDFWATNCGSCIRAIPSFERLQHRFGDSIQVLPVSYEKPLIVKSFLARNPIGKAMTLPVVTGDTTLSALFPHRIISHEVWIDATGIVIAITDPEYVNEKNVSAFLHHREISLPLKADVPAFDYTLPLFKGSPPAFYSLLSPYKPGVAPKFSVISDSVTHKIRIYMINFPVMQLYMFATDHLLYFPKNYLNIHIKDTTRLHVPKGAYRDVWKKDNVWCYEAVLPETRNPEEIKTSMITDLNRFFRFQGGMKCLPATSLVLVRTGSSIAAPLTAGGVPLNTLHSKNSIKRLTNASLSNIIWELNDLPGGLPAVDETGISGNVDMQLAFSSFHDLPGLNAALKPYGLAIKKEAHDLDFFVLRDAE